jgi:hypothetical protein
MTTPPRPEISDENDIEGLLGRFKPQPSLRFHQRMASAPWRASRSSSLLKIFATNRNTSKLAWTFSALLLILLIGTTLFVPQFRAIARQIIYSFLNAPSNRIEIQVTLSAPGDLFNFSDPANFQLNSNEAQQQAGYTIKQILPVPNNLSLIGARFDQDYKAVILLYHGDAFDLFLTQRQIGKGQDVFSIGQDATVQLAKVGSVQAEYVEGGWKALSTGTVSDTRTPENRINITAIWDGSLPQSTLRWQTGNMSYELRAVGEKRPALNDLISWANELK